MNLLDASKMMLILFENLRPLDGYDPSYYDALVVAANVLREKHERENPEPLTQKQLREMPEGVPTPLWLVIYGNPDKESWVLCDGCRERPGYSYPVMLFRGEKPLLLLDYGNTWIAYAHKPADGKMHKIEQYETPIPILMFARDKLQAWGNLEKGECNDKWVLDPAVKAINEKLDRLNLARMER